MAMTGLFGGYDPAAILEARAQQTTREAQAAGQGGGMYAPMLSAAYRMGDLAGSGIGRLFGMTDPVLDKATKAQEAANEVSQMDINQNDPQAVYGAMVKAFQARGLTDLAMPLMKELQGFKKAEQDLKSGALGIDKTQLEIYKLDPEKMRDVIAAETDPAKRDALIKTHSMFVRDRDLQQQSVMSDIAYKNALGAKAKAEVGRLNSEVANGNLKITPVSAAGGTLVYTDKNGNEIKRIVVPPADLAMLQGGGGGKAGGAGNEGGGDKTVPPAKKEGYDPSSRLLNNNNQQSGGSAPTQQIPGTQPVTPSPVQQPSPYDQRSGTYKLSADPIIQKIQQYAAANQAKLENDPEFRAGINTAMQDRKAQIQRSMGSGIIFQ